MKKIYQYTAAFAMAATSLMLNTACSENFFDGNDAENAVRVSSALVGTQAKTRAALNGSVFDADDNIAVSTAADGTAAATYTCGQNGTWTSAQPLAWGSTYPVTYYAAYPATATYSSFSLPTDQSGATANLSNATEKANYMTATTGALAAKPESKGISLAFTHRTAMIIVEIVGRGANNEGTLSAPVIYSPASNYAGGTATAAATAITPRTETPAAGEGEAKYTALVIPTSGSSDFKLFSVKVGGRECTFTTNTALTANHIYTYKLTVGTDRMVLSSLTVSDWTEKSVTGGIYGYWTENASATLSGSGTTADPYLISSAADLALMCKWINSATSGSDAHLSAVYSLQSDIDLSGKLWTPMTNDKCVQYGRIFRGTLSGNGHKIKNMKIRGTNTYAGLFGYMVGSSITDVHLVNADIETSGSLAEVGVMAGYASSIYLYGCTASGKIIYDNPKADQVYTALGGMIGYSFSSRLIAGCGTKVGITIPGKNVSSYHVGGFLGSSNSDNLTACYSQSSIMFPSGANTSYCVSGTSITTAALQALSKISYNQKMYNPADIQWIAQTDDANDCPYYMNMNYTPEAYTPPASLSTVADLQAYITWINGGGTTYGTTIKLANDIDLSGVTFTPIGSNAAFRGTFDGCGHTLKNVAVGENHGLFDYLGGGAVIKNLTAENFTGDALIFSMSQITGNILIDNCHIKGTCNIRRAGIIADISVKTSSTFTISRCSVESDITGPNDVGGLVGYSRTDGLAVKIYASYATGNMTTTGSSTNGEYVGGLAGQLGNATISGCYYKGVVDRQYSYNSSNKDYVGQISGYYDNSSCIYSAAIATGLDANKATRNIPLFGKTSNTGITYTSVNGNSGTITTSNYTNASVNITTPAAVNDVYSIITNSANTDTFVGGDGQTYKVKDCWTNNGTGNLPTLKVKADGTTPTMP